MSKNIYIFLFVIILFKPVYSQDGIYDFTDFSGPAFNPQGRVIFLDKDPSPQEFGRMLYFGQENFEELVKYEKNFQSGDMLSAEIGYRCLSIFFPGDPAGEWALFRQVLIQFEKGNYQSSYSDCERFLRIYPCGVSSALVEFYKAQNLFCMERYDEALDIFENLIKNNSAAVIREYVMLAESICLFHLEKYGRALRGISRLLSICPSDPVVVQAAYLYAGESWFFRGSFTDAEREYRKLIDVFDGAAVSNNARFRLTNVLFAQGKKEDAKNELNKLFDSFRHDDKLAPKIKYLIADTYYQEGNFASSRASYGELVEMYPHSHLCVLAHYNIAWCYLMEKKFESARTVFLDFYKKNQKHELSESALFLSAMASYLGRDLNQAAADLKNYYLTRKDSPFRDDSLYWLAWCRVREGDYERALGNFRIVNDKFMNSNLYEESNFMVCECLRMTNEHDFAKKSYQVFIDRFPSSGLVDDAMIGIGECYRDKNDFGQAYDVFDKVLELFPHTANKSYVMYEIAKMQATQGKFKKARDTFSSIIKKYPRSKYALQSEMQRALSYYKQKDYRTAIEKLDELAGRKDTEEYIDDIYYFSGWSYFKEGNFGQAVNMFKKIVAMKEQSHLSAEAALRIGDVYFEQKEYSLALDSYRYMVENYPDSDLASFGLYSWGESVRMLGFDKEAIAVWERLVELYPQAAMVEKCHQKIAQYYFEKGEYSQSIHYLEKIRDDFPLSKEAPQAMMKIGWIETNRSNYGRAEEIYRQVERDYPGTDYPARAKLCIASNYYKLDKSARVIKEIDEIAKKYPDSSAVPYAFELLMNIYIDQADESRAGLIRQKITEEFPKSEPAARLFLERGKDFLREGKLNDAIEKFSMAVEAYQGGMSAEAQKLLGDCYYKKGDFRQAVVEYLKTVYLFPDNKEWAAGAQFCAGIASEGEKQLQEAKKAYEKVIELYNNTDWVEKARVRLEALRGIR